MCKERKNPWLCLKTNCSSALFNGKKVHLECAPKNENGKILIPKSALDLLSIQTQNDYTSFDDISGVYKIKNDMGLIFFSDDEDILSLSMENDLHYMLSLANSFIFDIPLVKLSKHYAPATKEEREGFRMVGDYVLSILKSRNNKHPYILASKEVFDHLKSIYETKSPEEEYNYIVKLINHADKQVSDLPPLNENGVGFSYPYPSSGYGENEYDAGGRHTESENRLAQLKSIAFAHRITGEEKYARIAYYGALEIIARKHWGPGHFLNCSGATGNLAQIYDWLCPSWKELNLDTCAVKRGIYSHGIHHGFNSAIHDSCDFPSPQQGTGWRFKLKPDNWNSVCNSGLILGALCILDGEDDGALTKQELENTKELLGLCLISNTQDGLVYKQYAPDGSYVESNSYWSYGTNNLFKTMGALYTALGTDLGMHHGCGVDKTCYYAINSESADFVGWNYHDGYLSMQDTSMFNLFATISGDDILYALRASHLKRGKSVTMEDMLFHPSAHGRTIPPLESMSLDYAMTGIDAFVVRDGWESGSLYAGMMGGENPTGGSHNQLDSGSFVYHNLGKLWITDLGADNYNVGKVNGEGYFSNYGLYRRNAEGNNTLCLKSLPYGQLLGRRGIMTDFISGDKKSYCIIDNKEVYGDSVTAAKRGMLLINGRKTLIISDEIDFNDTDTAFWVAHFESDKIKAELLNNDTECALTHNDGQKIHLSLISENAKFEIMNCYDFLLDGTAPAEGEHSRENHSRIVVKFENVRSIKLSVVIEAEKSDTYKDIIPMEMWKTL